MGIHLTKVTAPYLIRKRGMFYLQKRVPKALVGHWNIILGVIPKLMDGSALEIMLAELPISLKNH